MKYFLAIVLFAVVAVAFAAEVPSEAPKEALANPILDAQERDKRGVLLSYSSPITYPYPSALAYNYPYAYRSYPYSPYYSSYYLG